VRRLPIILRRVEDAELPQDGDYDQADERPGEQAVLTGYDTPGAYPTEHNRTSDQLAEKRHPFHGRPLPRISHRILPGRPPPLRFSGQDGDFWGRGGFWGKAATRLALCATQHFDCLFLSIYLPATPNFSKKKPLSRWFLVVFLLT
jgi:hypothetical protein